MDCVYCSDKTFNVGCFNYLFHKNFSDKTVKARIFKYYKTKEYSLEVEDSDGSINDLKINYCMMCGRKLN